MFLFPGAVITITWCSSSTAFQLTADKHNSVVFSRAVVLIPIGEGRQRYWHSARSADRPPYPVSWGEGGLAPAAQPMCEAAEAVLVGDHCLFLSDVSPGAEFLDPFLHDSCGLMYLPVTVFGYHCLGYGIADIMTSLPHRGELIKFCERQHASDQGFSSLGSGLRHRDSEMGAFAFC